LNIAIYYKHYFSGVICFHSILKFMNRIANKGFTLIELLVVIAIIGILSSVVLASLNTARTKGSDASIKATLSGIRAQAEIVYDTLGSYGIGYVATAATWENCPSAAGNSLFGTTTITTQIAGARTATGGAVADVKCVQDVTSASNASKWAIAVKLKTDATLGWCVDSSGASKQITFSAASGAGTGSLCP
jgi:type IV pilus assembly protein PilA